MRKPILTKDFSRARARARTPRVATNNYLRLSFFSLLFIGRRDSTYRETILRAREIVRGDLLLFRKRTEIYARRG